MTPVYMPPSPSVNVTPHELPDRHLLQLEAGAKNFKVPPPPLPHQIGPVMTSQKGGNPKAAASAGRDDETDGIRTYGRTDVTDDMSGVSTDGGSNGCPGTRDSMASSSSSSASSTSSAVSSDSAFCETSSNTSSLNLSSPHHNNSATPLTFPPQIPPLRHGRKVSHPQNAHPTYQPTLNTHSSQHFCVSNIVAVRPPINPIVPFVLYQRPAYTTLAQYSKKKQDSKE